MKNSIFIIIGILITTAVVNFGVVTTVHAEHFATPEERCTTNPPLSASRYQQCVANWQWLFNYCSSHGWDSTDQCIQWPVSPDDGGAVAEGSGNSTPVATPTPKAEVETQETPKPTSSHAPVATVTKEATPTPTPSTTPQSSATPKAKASTTPVTTDTTVSATNSEPITFGNELAHAADYNESSDTKMFSTMNITGTALLLAGLIALASLYQMHRKLK